MKWTDKIKKIKQRPILFSFFLLVIIVVVGESADRCSGGIVYQLNKMGWYIKPVLNEKEIIMKEGWVPMLKSELTELGPNVVDIRFDKIKGCSVIDSINIQSANFNQVQLSHIRKRSGIRNYPWGDVEILDVKSSDGRYMVFLEGFDLALFTNDLSNLDEIDNIYLLKDKANK